MTTLEGMLDESEIKEIAGKPFGIDPKSDYDRKEFVFRAGEFFDLSEYYAQVSQNSGDIGALKDLVGKAADYIEGDDEYKKDWISRATQNPHLAIARGDAMLGTGQISMAKYVEKNRDEFLNKLQVEKLHGIIFSQPLYSTGEEKHDKIKDLISKIRKINEAIEKEKKGEHGAIDEVIQKEFKDLIATIPEEHKIYLNEDISYALPKLKEVLIRRINRKAGMLFRDKDGNLDKNEIVSYLKRNYKAVEDNIENVPKGEEHNKERFKIWDKNLKLHYLTLAQALYGQEKPGQEEDNDKDKQARKKESAEKGIRT
jgi:hypothetical protein